MPHRGRAEIFRHPERVVDQLPVALRVDESVPVFVIPNMNDFRVEVDHDNVGRTPIVAVHAGHVEALFDQKRVPVPLVDNGGDCVAHVDEQACALSTISALIGTPLGAADPAATSRR